VKRQREIIEIILVCMLISVGMGCQKSKAKESLPPPTGLGAAPLPDFPAIKSAEQEQAEAASDQLVVTGTVLPIAEAKVGAKTTGVIAAMRVEEGDRVKSGQVLFKLDADNQVLAMDQAEAALDSAMVAQNTARTEFQRARALRERGSISPALYDQTKAQLDGAAAAVKLARVAAKRAKQAVIDTTIRAPINGVVSRRMADVGDTVTLVPPTVVLIIQDISELEIRGRAPETMLAKLKPGSAVKVRFPSIGVEKTIAITRINPSVDPMTRTIEVVARLQNEEQSLKAGMLVELDFGEQSDNRDMSPEKQEAQK
jgi:RND family efflux transporter MFP subunit